MNEKINIYDIGEDDFEEKVIKLSLDYSLFFLRLKF